MEKCVFGKQEVFLPEVFLEKAGIFRDIMSTDTWKNVLTEDERHHLMDFLPTFPENDSVEKLKTVQRLFDGENFKFGNPLKQVQSRLRDGYFSPDISKYYSMCRRAKYREYKIRQQRYFTEMLKSIVISRQRVLAEVRYLAPDQLPSYVYQQVDNTNELILENQSLRSYYKVMESVRTECGIEDSSSDEEMYHKMSNKRPFKLSPPSSVDVSTVSSTLTPRPDDDFTSIDNGNSTSTPVPTKKSKSNSAPHEITDAELIKMLKHHRQCHELDPDAPHLNTEDVTLEDIIDRFQFQPMRKCSSGVKSLPMMSPSSSVARRRIRTREQLAVRRVKKMKTAIKTRVKVTPVEAEMDEAPAEEVVDEVVDEAVDAADVKPLIVPLMYTPRHAANFFSLLRDIVRDAFPEGKASTPKIEEKVREWQESAYSIACEWGEEKSWVGSVVSALKFLSGDALGLDAEGFIPLVDYKERAQQWKWIGGGRDSDGDTEALCRSWSQSRHNHTIDALEAPPHSPPPPRTRTDYIVRPTSQDEKDAFRDQEWRRFNNPQRGFTYDLHGYRSVVGPVKGVYSKDSIANKAREHALLINDRPPYVTILTLVRDAAARLPNGEGTRGDICELLKDSCFMAPGVTDAQLNTVVSGALDRLHYEKDPCVKYDVNRKLWIYLHRNRTEHEFERLHHAQGAAVKAKKSLHKPKTVKRTKEPVPPVTITPATTPTPTKPDPDTTNPLSSIAQLISQNSEVIAAATLTPSPHKSSLHRSPTTVVKTPQGTTVSQALNLLHNARGPGASTTAIFDTSSQSAILADITPGQSDTSGSAVTLAFVPPLSHAPFSDVSLVQPKRQKSRGTTAAPAVTPTDKLLNTTLLVSSGLAKTLPSKPLPAKYTPTKTLSTTAFPLAKPTLSMASSSHSSVIAHLIQQSSGATQQPQVISMSDLLSGANKMTAIVPPTSTITLRGSNMVQPMTGKTIQLSGKPLSAAINRGLLQFKPSKSMPGGMGIIQMTTPTTGVNVPTQQRRSLQVASTLGHMIQVVQPTPSKASSSPQTGLVMTQLPHGGVTLRPGVHQIASGSKVDPSMLATQFIVQAPVGSDHKNSPQAKTLLSASKPQNIQLLKTVITQPGSIKPGQTTFLISQPGLSPASVATTVTRNAPQQPQTMLARIIMPPAGIRLAGQGTAPGYSFIQAVTAVPTSLTSSVTIASSGVSAMLTTTTAGAVVTTSS